MTHRPATGEGLVSSFVGEDTGSVCVLSERASVDPIASAARGTVLSVWEINWPQD